MTAANLPREARALLDAIAVGESDPMAKHEGISPYVILYGGGSFERMPDRAGYNGFPEWPGKDNSHAAGRYQFQPATWRGIVPQFKPGIPNFRNPDDQDWGAWFLARHDYRARTGIELLAVLRSRLAIDQVGDILQPTWTSMSSSTFGQRYAAALAIEPPAPPAPVPVPEPIPPQPPPTPEPQPSPAPDLIAAFVQLLQSPEMRTLLEAYRAWLRNPA